MRITTGQRRKFWLGTVAATALATVAAPASAQGIEEQAAGANAANAPADDAAQTPTAVDQPSDGDIVVTARRRAENVQDVPIALTVYSGEALERQGAVDITDLSDTTPNVTLEVSRGSNTTLTAFIRGVGQQDPVPGFEAGVGLYLDDVFLNRPQAAVLDIYDVERIEVLRGPQGTLYGRNTIGGAIKYVTRRLGDSPTFRARANLGNYKQADLILSGSLPLGDVFRVGASVARLSRGGFGDNLFFPGVENYNRDIYAARGTIEANGANGSFFRLSGDYTKDKSDPRNGHRLIPGLLSGAPVLDDVYDTRAGLNTPQQKVEARGIAFHAEFPLGEDLTLRNIAAFRSDKTSTPIDFDSLPAADVDVPAIYRNRQVSNELQLVYEGDRLQGLLGAYYLDANAEALFDVILGTTGAAIGVPGFTASTFGDVDTKSYAFFGDFTFDLTEQFAVSVGGRYTSDKRSSRILRRNLRGGADPRLGGAGTLLAVTSDFQGSKTFEKFTPRASVSFKPTDDHNIYASYSKGFKGGGFDPRGVSTVAPDLNGNGAREASEIFDYFLFDPETVDSYEIGWKGRLFDNRLRFSLAGFYADYKDVQVPGSVGAVINGVATFVGVTTNAGAATFKGFEAEANATLLRDFAGAGSRFNLSGTFGYLDAEYDEFITNVAGFDANGNPTPGSRAQPVDVANFRRIQNTPKYTASGTADLSLPVAGGDLSALATVSYRSKTFQFETPSPFLDQPGYTLVDASLVYNFAGDRFTIGLHGKNLTDKQYITSGYQFLTVNPVTGVPTRNATTGNVVPSLGREGVVTAFYGNPRQVFVSLGVNF